MSGFRNTGDEKVNVVAVSPVSEILTSDESLTILPNGNILAPGYPLITFLISTVTERVSSLSEKYRSREVTNLPSDSTSPCTENV